MRKRLRAGLCLCLILLTLLGSLPAAAAETPSGLTLLLQTGTGSAVRNGETAAAPAPLYAQNGALMVPLRFVAESLGYTVTWDSASGRASVSGAEGEALAFVRGSWTGAAGGRAVVLPSPAEVRNGTLYVPLLALTGLERVYVHAFGFYDGGFLTVTDYPLTEGDRSGTPNESFAPESPDPALLECRDAALQALGPNEGLFDRTALVLRRDSRHAVAGGEAAAISQKGESAAPYQSGDGYLMIPAAFCARALGGAASVGADGAVTVTCNGRTAVFPPENGYVTVDGVRLEHPYYGGSLRDGTAYCSVYAFTSALGLHGYDDAETKGILISPYDLSAHPALLQHAWSRAAGLPLKSDEDAKGYLALTFDDGPSGRITSRLLDGLKARDVHATFFLCDYRIQLYPSLMSRYLSEGHELGNHSASHATLTACSAASLAAEVDDTNRSIESAAGVRPTLLRPPGGAYNRTVLSALADRGMSCILWSVDPLDWKYRNKETVVQNILSTVKDGDIILMHDMYETSVDAALSIIDTLQAQGYRFVTVSELAERRGVSLQPGAVYSQLR